LAPDGANNLGGMRPTISTTTNTRDEVEMLEKTVRLREETNSVLSLTIGNPVECFDLINLEKENFDLICCEGFVLRLPRGQEAQKVQQLYKRS
jgi:hypothetical protein